jgi:ADP-ribosyl-[dinitrogen reductase] hydrolase
MMRLMDKKFSRFRGTMLGVAVGDALGAPLEGLKPGRIQQIYGRVEGLVDPGLACKDKPWRWRMPGLYTDDTQQALILADSLVKCHGFDAAFFASRLVEMAQAKEGLEFGAFRGTGRNFRQAVERLRQGADPLLAGNISAGIGPSMRVAPVGLFYADDRDDMLKAAVEQGLLTNRDPRAIEAAAGVAFCVAQSARGEWDDTEKETRANDLIEFMEMAALYIKDEYLSYLPVQTWEFCGRVSSAIRNFRFYLDMDEKDVYKQIVMEANRSFPEFNISSPAQGFALAGPVTAMYLGITSPAYTVAVVSAINLGRDSDSVAAITGAIMGARKGVEEVPDSFQNKIINLDQVIMRADALLEKSFQGLAIQDVIQMEMTLTLTESEERSLIKDKFEKDLRKKGKRAKKPPGQRTAGPQQEQQGPTREERLSRRKKLKKPRRIKSPWRGGTTG